MTPLEGVAHQIAREARVAANCAMPGWAYSVVPPSGLLDSEIEKHYLAFAAMLMAGLDGVQNRIDPGAPIDKNLYDLPPQERANIPSTPGTLEKALDALEHDHQFLLKGDVFTKDLVETYLDYKRSREIDEMRLRPHPYEFLLYYDC